MVAQKLDVSGKGWAWYFTFDKEGKRVLAKRRVG